MAHTGEQSDRVEPDTSVSGGTNIFLAEEPAEEDTEADSWAEVMAAAEMAQKAANNKARAGSVKSENPLFQPMGAEGAVVLQEAAVVHLRKHGFTKVAIRSMFIQT